MFLWLRFCLLAAASLCILGTCSSRSMPCLCKSVQFPGVTAPARDSSTHCISPLCSSSTEPAFCFIHKITTALIQFGHFTCLQAEPTARQVLTPREVKLSNLGKPCIILKLLSLLHSYINAHTHTHAHTHNRELVIPSSHSSILRSKQFSEPILPFPLHYHHTGVPCTFSSCKHKLISPAQTLPLNPADEVSYKKQNKNESSSIKAETFKRKKRGKKKKENPPSRADSERSPCSVASGKAAAGRQRAT